MKNNQIKIIVPQEVVDYLQRLSFEVQTRSEIVTKLIEDHMNDETDALFTSKPFTKYSSELSRIKAEFELLKEEIAKKYVPEVLYNKHTYNWNIDFATNEMTIDILCDCGIEVAKEYLKTC